MPILPTYESKNNVNANVAQPFRSEVAQPFEDQQKIIGALQKTTQAWSDAHDTMQFTEAKAKYDVATFDIQARAAADPDFKNSERYYKEIDEAKTVSLQGISNSQVANKLKTEFDFGGQIAKIKIDSGFKTKQLSYNKVMVKTNLDSLQQKKLAAATPAEAMHYDAQINELLDDNVKSGVLTYEEADKELKDAQTTAVKYEIYADSATDEKESAVLRQLKDPNGKYSYLDPKARLNMVEESQRRIFQNNQTFKRGNEISKNDRFQNIFQKSNEGTLTLADLDAEQKASEFGDPGALTMKEILDIRKGIQSRVKTDLETIVNNDVKAADYLKFVDNFIADETDRQKGREAIVAAFKDGILSPKEASLLNSLKREAEGVEKIRNREGFMQNNLVPFKNAINSVNDFFTGKKNFTESDKAMAIKELLSGSADGKNDPAVLKDEIIKGAIIKKNPAILNLSPDGQLVVDENGYLKIMNNKGEHRDPNKPAAQTKENK